MFCIECDEKIDKGTFCNIHQHMEADWHLTDYHPKYCFKCGKKLPDDNPDRYCEDCYPYDDACDVAHRINFWRTTTFP